MNNLVRTLLIALTIVAVQNNADAQGKYGAGEDSVKCVENLSLYQEFYKQKNYKDAHRPWSKAVATCPKSSKNLYIYGAKMFKTYIKDEKDKAKKESLIDSLFWIYETRIEHFGQKHKVNERYGADMFRFRKSEVEKAEALLMGSFEALGNKAQAGTLAFLYQANYELQKDGKRTKEDMIKLYPRLMAVVEEQEIAGNGKKYLKAKEAIDQIFQKVADCESLIPFYKAEWQKAPEDVKLLKEMTAVLDKKDCQDDPLFYEASVKLAELEPSAKAYYNLGIVAIKREKWTDAADYFDKSASQADVDPSTKEKALINASKANLKLSRYSTAAAKAREAGTVNPDNGEVHLLIADAYAFSAGACGDNECTNKAAFWVAYDEVLKAKAKDPSLADKVNKKAGQYKGNFPGGENCFFHSITEGSSYTVGCWINKTTTVRLNK